MNIIFSGPFYQEDGWGKAAADYLRALLLTGHRVRANFVRTAAYQSHKNPEFSKYENTPFDKPDVYIHKYVPSALQYVPNAYNIAISVTETRHLEKTGWIDALNNMDEVWVPTPQEKSILEESGLTKPCAVIRMPFDLESLDDALPLEEPEFQDDFIFLGLAEWAERKDIESLILAYWREFKAREPVRLLLKTRLPGPAGITLNETIMKFIERLQSVYRLYPISEMYPEILIITDNIGDEKIIAMQKRIDCFVTTSHGESTCRPLIECCYLGKTCLSPSLCSCTNTEVGIIPVNSWEVPARCFQPPISNIYTANETWSQVDVIDLQKKMRAAFEKQFDTSKQREKVNEQYSYSRAATEIHNRLSRLPISDR